MPRVLSVRVLRLWLAFTLNDYGETGPPKLGLTRRQAEMRAAFAEPVPPPHPGVPTLDLMEEGQPLGTEPLFTWRWGRRARQRRAHAEAQACMERHRLTEFVTDLPSPGGRHARR